jgi:serine-type D-Ala-D-Ala carboxypeptidase (penicillin-binding protein 5/6)
VTNLRTNAVAKLLGSLVVAAALVAQSPPAQGAPAPTLRPTDNFAAAVQRRLPPPLSAPSAILIDARDGHVLYRRDPDARRPIASTTKLMTALLSIERLPLQRRLRAAPYHAMAAESQIELAAGERLSVADLLRGLMLESANDAAVTLARGAGGSVRRFVRLMNRKARELGLSETHYANPVGLDESGNYSSARDLAALARIVLRNDFLAETVDMPRARLLTGSHPRIVDNRNDLVERVPWIDGVKTGHTSEAGYVLVGAGSRKAATLVSAVLDTPSEGARDADTLALLEWGFSQYRRVPVLARGHAVVDPKVAYFGDRRTELVAARSVVLGLRRGEAVRTRVDAPSELHGPLAEGSRVGSVSVFVDGKRVRTVTLVTGEAVPKAGALRKVAHAVIRPWALIVLVLLAALTVERRRRRLAAAEAARRRRRQAARLD